MSWLLLKNSLLVAGGTVVLSVLAPLAILARFWHRLIGSLRDQNHLAAALVTAVLRPPRRLLC